MATSGFERLAIRLRDLSCLAWVWYRQISIRTALVLAPLLAGLLGLLFVCYVLKWDSGRALPFWWSYFVPSSWLHLFWMLAVPGVPVFLMFRAARKWPTAANSAAFLGVLTTAILVVVMRVCDVLSGIVAGTAVLGIVIAMPTLAKFVAGKASLIVDRFVDETERVPLSFSGVVAALQIAMSVFMGFLVLVAFTHEFDPAVRPLLLVFAGVGMTATASIKSELSVRNLMAFAGLVVSVMGSYMQIDQVFDVGVIMVAVGVLTFFLFMFVAFDTNRVVPIVTVPIAAAVLVMSLMTLAVVMPAIFIGYGCGVGEEPFITTVELICIVVIASGIATWVILTLMLLVKRRQRRAMKA